MVVQVSWGTVEPRVVFENKGKQEIKINMNDLVHQCAQNVKVRWREATSWSSVWNSKVLGCWGLCALERRLCALACALACERST